MGKTNGRAEVGLDDQLKADQLKAEQLKTEQTKAEQLKNEQQKQTLENELPIADPADGFDEKSVSGDRQGPVAVMPKARSRSCALSVTIYLIVWRGCKLSLITIASARQKRALIFVTSPYPMRHALCCR